MSHEMDWHAVWLQAPQLAKGLVFTLQIAFAGYAASLVLGLLVALLRMSPWWPLRSLAFAYTQFFRAISIYIYVIWIYFGLTMVTGLDLTPFAASVISIALLHSAYLSEVYRAAIQGVDKGQREAAGSLGLGRVSTFFEIVLPQAMLVAVPQLVSQFAMIVKDSAVVALIGASDLMAETIRAANLEHRTFEFYTTAALVYLALVIAVSRLGRLLERRLSRQAH
ncbi:amino acid ABC transporter permease [Verticiella sediminum]|uniref:Amino acid ABC transporter permease n=1 Tax=Verticiella sediminum TaxID=1247510 RepID=A0A556AIW0_9BURK|nr:amino acid ABC transporter permease [Verticiella sediminum]TSH92838.1 amino acid ABC transporter permease [Verticiella sediminum]